MPPQPRRLAGLRATAWCLALIHLGSGCAHIETSTDVRIVAKRDAKPQQFGSPYGQVTSRGVAAQWTQTLDMLEVRLHEIRSCAVVMHEPVVRVHRTRRTPDAGFYVEWGLGAGLLGVGIAGLIQPRFLASSGVDTDGNVVRDENSGYRLAAVFGTIGLLLVTAAVVDSFRARDSVTYVDAYRRLPSQPVSCQEPRGPLSGTTVTLHIDKWSTRAVTNDEGVASFRLPPESQLEESTNDPPAGSEKNISESPRERTPHRAVVRTGPNQAVMVDYVTPYGTTYRKPHTGSVERAPTPE